jgi:outer membrane lipoprotein-sorting protein
LVPVLAFGAVVAFTTVPSLVTSADSPPDLPALTPAELLAKARAAQVTDLSGTVKLSALLGLPSLDSLGAIGGGGSGTSVASLLAGDHTAKIWIDGADKVRIATIAPLAETNWIRNGHDVWSYDSGTLTTTHATIPADTTGTADEGTGATPDPIHDTPLQFAQNLLDQVTPSTTVSIDTPSRVAGRPVYQLVLTPNDPASTVGNVTFSIDAATGLPLDVKVDARSTGSTALELGFTDISFDAPAPSTFEFTPPPGSTVVEAKSPSDLLSTGGDPHHDGERHHHDKASASGSSVVETTATGQAGGADPLSSGNYTTLGSDWTSVVVTDNSSLRGQLGAVLQSAPEVTVGTTHGRLISTSLFNVLVLDDGRVAVGAVDPATLQSLVAGA